MYLSLALALKYPPSFVSQLYGSETKCFSPYFRAQRVKTLRDQYPECLKRLQLSAFPLSARHSQFHHNHLFVQLHLRMAISMLMICI